MKMKNTEIILLIVGLLLSAVAIFTVLRHRANKEETAEIQLTPRKIHGGPCPGETKILKQSDPYMRGIIEPGQDYKVILNFYDCNPVKKGDLVLYSLSSNMEPVVKIARAVEGDRFKTVKDKEHKAWNLLVNDEMVLNETDHKPYFFGGEMSPTLALYEKSHKGKVFTNEVIVLSSWAPGDGDSGIFGMTNIIDILGKVVKIDQKDLPKEPAKSKEVPKKSAEKAIPVVETKPKSEIKTDAKPEPKKSPAKTPAKPKTKS